MGVGQTREVFAPFYCPFDDLLAVSIAAFRLASRPQIIRSSPTIAQGEKRDRKWVRAVSPMLSWLSGPRPSRRIHANRHPLKRISSPNV